MVDQIKCSWVRFVVDPSSVTSLLCSTYTTLLPTTGKWINSIILNSLTLWFLTCKHNQSMLLYTYTVLKALSSVNRVCVYYICTLAPRQHPLLIVKVWYLTDAPSLHAGCPCCSSLLTIWLDSPDCFCKIPHQGHVNASLYWAQSEMVSTR